MPALPSTGRREAGGGLKSNTQGHAGRGGLPDGWGELDHLAVVAEFGCDLEQHDQRLAHFLDRQSVDSCVMNVSPVGLMWVALGCPV